MPKCNSAVEMKGIIKDKREIQGVYFDQVQFGFTIGNSGITKIESYEEFSHGCVMPYIAIYKNNFLWQRIPAHLCRIQYAEKGA